MGAGSGRLTALLANRAAQVTAIELDHALVTHLRRAFAGSSVVSVIAGDILRVGLPSSPYRVFGNVPFAITTSVLRRLLDDPSGPLQRADLIVQAEVAEKRTAARRSSQLSLGWGPWWSVSTARRISRAAFAPPPTVDAAMLVIERRRVPLLDPAERSAYLGELHSAFRSSSQPLGRQLRRAVGQRGWKRFTDERGLPFDVRPFDLDVFDWVAAFRMVSDLRG
ncbi:MAG: rRNA (adenine-N6)-dimethyltransferase [Actinomycetota bacterium]|jgi:23S rRNA (adenine-N6)-dimethyltransferase|nr:rRNA (adenine-N6)-dimethyltransferase [Actinomycetota bacterium]